VRVTCSERNEWSRPGQQRFSFFPGGESPSLQPNFKASDDEVVPNAHELRLVNYYYLFIGSKLGMATSCNVQEANDSVRHIAWDLVDLFFLSILCLDRPNV
jgi:hypothetical protein